MEEITVSFDIFSQEVVSENNVWTSEFCHLLECDWANNKHWLFPGLYGVSYRLIDQFKRK